jgi:hypothetical protein
LTEILNDSASLLLPVTRDAVEAALRGLKIAPLLQGYRGAPPVNMVAVLDAVLAVQAYALDNRGHIAEVEINPLICGQATALAADALIKIGS